MRLGQLKMQLKKHWKEHRNCYIKDIDELVTINQKPKNLVLSFPVANKKGKYCDL